MDDQHATAERLAKTIHEGGREIPEPVERSPLVRKPTKIEAWRIFKIMAEFVEGFDIIRRYTLAATFFGSSRTEKNNPYAIAASELAGQLSRKGFAIITGGAAGIMRAANKGAYDAGGTSIGLNIELPDAQMLNKYLTENFTFDHFFVRKVMLTYASEVYVYFPGGFGTLDEFFEIITLIQTKKIRRVPMILFGRDYWGTLLATIDKVVCQTYHNINPEDLELYTIVDSVEEACQVISKQIGANCPQQPLP